ncbi:gfo/Idh/MocA family oxidoreductase [Blastopirellula marina]|uniref:Gfo/Idh/MocA family oxidoreductase n=1 Tax=Blastopirellula marina TaxID=124 RepID=A0A2S8F607_9BACT|nr:MULTISPECIES: Gfo/Idh/MocA family oxidoreductase [Pirellulaceae]PQO27573.1 gfo/Idh/MocA family oxidoreductase [Blastopirellula marina]RCS48110.1 gfo/Idh/MocA family oxidoreductase [Bremerella cremea]
MTIRKTRREFLEDSMFAAAAAAAFAAPTSLIAAEKQSKSPNEKLHVAVVGLNGRGNAHIGGYTNRDDVIITHLCDVDSKFHESKVEGVAKRQDGHKPKFETDLRKILDDPSVDIVSIATPNHLHSLQAIWALQAGKDVYVEKPVSHNVSEGRRVVEAARKYERICQAGTQSRSNPGMIEAIEFVHSGKIGDVKVARGLCYKPRKSIGPKGNYEPPQTVDYNLWLGPAQMQPVTRPQFHYDWHWQMPFGNGDLGNQGIHQMDLARWGLNANELSNAVISYGGRFGYEDAGDTPNTQVVVHDYGDRSLVFEVRGLVYDKKLKESSVSYKGSKIGVIFEGTDGYLVMTTYHSGSAFDKDGNKIRDFNGGGDQNHYNNFIEAVRSREVDHLNGDILEGHLSSALCHTGLISYQMGEQVSPAECLERMEAIKTTENVRATMERVQDHLRDNGVNIDSEGVTLGPMLAFDPKTEKFIGNEKADQYLSRECRKGFEIPAEGKV